MNMLKESFPSRFPSLKNRVSPCSPIRFWKIPVKTCVGIAILHTPQMGEKKWGSCWVNLIEMLDETMIPNGTHIVGP